MTGSLPALPTESSHWDRALYAFLVEKGNRSGCLSTEDVTFGVAAIGASVVDTDGAVVAAVSMAELRHEYEGDRAEALAAEVLNASESMSCSIGGKRNAAGFPVSQRRGRSSSSTG